MAFKTRYDIEKEDLSNGWRGSAHNDVKVERTGFIPLAVRLKQFTIAGLQMSLQSKQYDFEDYKEIYHDLDTISPYDDIETTQDKLNEYYSKLSELQLLKQAELNASKNEADNFVQKESFVPKENEAVPGVD